MVGWLNARRARARENGGSAVMFRVQSHDSELVLVRTDQPGNAVMGRLGSATLSRELRGYLVPVGDLGRLGMLVDQAGGRILDERKVERSGESHQVVPLPECANCGTPRRRNIVRSADDFEPAPAPAFCADCGHEWSDHQHDPRPPREDVGHCPGCRRPQVPGKAFCHHCGTAQPSRRHQAATAASEAALDVLQAHLANQERWLSPAQVERNRKGLTACREALELARSGVKAEPTTQSLTGDQKTATAVAVVAEPDDDLEPPW